MSTTVRIATRVTPRVRVAAKHETNRQYVLHAAVVLWLALLASGVNECQPEP
jgi:hypothetical protein